MCRRMVCGAVLIGIAGSAAAAEQGITDTEILLGQTMPYSGPASSYSSQGKLAAAYYNMVNSKGGVNGRKIRLISLDDGYSPPKAVEQTRKLVEQDEVFAMVGTVGTPSNSAVQRYLNAKKIPQLFIASGAAKWDDPKNFPYTTALYPPYQMEGRIFAKFILSNKPNAKLGIFSQNDDAGRDYVRGLKEGLGDRAAQIIVKEVTYEPTDPTVDSQIVALKASGADTLFTMAIPKYGAQAIRKVAELGWKPLNFVVSVASSIKGTLEPAGLENSKDILTAIAFKNPTDPRWKDSSDVQEFLQFLKEWFPQGNLADASLVTGYISGFVTVKALENAGRDLTRQGFLKSATTFSRLEAPMLLPGISITTRPDRYSPYSQMQIARFDGTSWIPEGPVISAGEESP